MPKTKSGVRNGNRSLGGPSQRPSRALTKKFQYVQYVSLNNATSTYAHFRSYEKPDISLATGALAQFDAYELWRLKRIQVSIQMAPRGVGVSNAGNLNAISSATVWTAADYGANESVSGESIQQYQNAKRNTVSFNKWTKIVDTDSMINTSLQQGNSYSFMLPKSTWVNTTVFDSSFYSGYQLFIMGPGFQDIDPAATPGFTIQTELEVEFMQPAFQASPSTFNQTIYDCKLQVIPDANLPDDYRTYVFDNLTAERDVNGQRGYSLRLVREDGIAGSLTYTAAEFLSLYRTFTSGQYFGDRRVIYDGPRPDQYRLE